ncbi:MAG TPA: hypothetical protein PKC68_08700 [Alphaproteobacteria bacterium]|jgi:hypothetical protein|nr:hypothetical protein [Alphaproteobacteria bacterium]HMS45824.1 hypothetical protein [Alphaproteobacteria bacterium]
MTENERDRLTRLEVTSHQMAQDIHQIRLTVEQLREAFNMGRGAAYALVKLGSVVIAFLAMIAWILDHLPAWLK